MNELHVLAILYAIATLDGLFSGICAASGRNALIDKRRYFSLAMVQGVLWAQAISMVALGLLTAVVTLADDRTALIDQLFFVGQKMASVYLTYSIVVLATFFIRVIPSVDVRSATSTLILGPLTFLRPFVILGGAVWSLLVTQSPLSVWLTIGVLISLMLPFRIGLRYWFHLHPLPLRE